MAHGRQANYVTQYECNNGAVLGGNELASVATATQVRVVDGETVVTDGPYAETKEQLGGYFLLDCDNLDEAIAWAKKIPARGGAVEVRPVMDFSQEGAGQ